MYVSRNTATKKNGYDIFQIDKSSEEIEGEQGVRLGADDAAYIYLKEVEE